MARRIPRDATDTELAILEILWERGEATRREVTDILYPQGAAAHYATVQKLLERLEGKGLVRKRRAGAVLAFSATIDREALIRHRLKDVAEKLCGGSLTPLLMNLVRSKPLKPRELDELQGFLEELRKQMKPRGKAE
jgi:BlaI family transcriptional regulator, penicillinase repressor